MTQALWLAVAIVLWLMGLASLGLGIVGLVRGLPWAYVMAVILGLVFSIAAGFSIGFYTLLWPLFILGQLLSKGHSTRIRLITGAVSCVAWIVLLASIGVTL
ncbi:MAG: hypothetical protein M0Z66_05110 [Thermaerobacter sp.]|nr:hypothetical protein [Thermaerobacter sp.]